MPAYKKKSLDLKNLPHWLTHLKNDLVLNALGLTVVRLPAGKGYTFMHQHKEQEEVYIIIDGKGIICKIYGDTIGYFFDDDRAFEYKVAGGEKGLEIVKKDVGKYYTNENSIFINEKSHFPVIASIPNGNKLGTEETVKINLETTNGNSYSKVLENYDNGSKFLPTWKVSKGSENIEDDEHFKIISESGGTMNGTTSKDRTNYYQTVPSNQLETALWLEADRMGFLLDAVTQEKFENQRNVVKNEKKQTQVNVPYGMFWEIKDQTLYPKGHPYSWPIVGDVHEKLGYVMDARSW